LKTESGAPRTLMGVAEIRARDWEDGVQERAPAEAPSLEQLYRQFFGFTWRSLRHLGVSEVSLEDAAQDVWLTVHRQLPRFEGRSTHRTWLFGITLNVARNHHRNTRRHPPGAALSENVAAKNPGPESQSEANESLALVQRFIETLDEPRRILFVTHIMEGLTPAESAEVLGVDVSTLYESVRRLRRALERWFEAQQRRGAE
jgi:RNA polymerase sigma-70 factor, ECF subfamily